MKLIRMIFVFTVLLVGCDKKNVQLNDITESFKSFQETDSLHFIPITDEIIGEPMKMLYIKEHLLLRINASPGDSFLVNYSLKDNKCQKIIESSRIVNYTCDNRYELKENICVLYDVKDAVKKWKKF